MSSPQGKTATILGTTTSADGRMWYVKQNQNAQLTDIEFHIYQAAKESLAAEYHIPEVRKTDDQTILIVETAGDSLENLLHIPQDLDQKREQFVHFLTQNLAIRAKLNHIINQTLTEQDQQFLLQYNHQKLHAAMKQLAPQETAITAEDVETHFWAYRVLNALGKYDTSFKEAYTAIIGTKIDELLAKNGGTWLQDNCLRNNASPDSKIIIPFDFNSFQYGLPQMDEAGITGMYIFNGILAVYDTPDEREKFIGERAAQAGEDLDSYRLGYILSIIHQNALLAGYRTQEAKSYKKELNGQKQQYGGVLRETQHAFRKAFDEIEYQHAPCIEAMDTYLPLLVHNPDDEQKWQYLSDFITQHTFVQRVGMML